jgi:ribosomal protein RSM22 (predicted rRNA methylase)
LGASAPVKKTARAPRAARPARPAPPRLRVTLVDHDRAALEIAAAACADVARALGLDAAFDVHVADVTAPLPRGGCDLTIAGSVLNELEPPAAAAVAAALVAALTPGGVALVIEPALRATTRALHVVRDRLIAAGTAAVLGPCTRRDAPCPALADPDDWCHDHRPFTLPPRARQLAHVTGLRDGDLKLAYLALARPGDAPPAPGTWRVVTDPHASKGKRELTLCGAPGWVPIRLLNRHRSVENRPHERARRGDVLAVEPDALAPLKV